MRTEPARPWTVWHWIALVMLVPVHAAVMLVATAYVVISTSGVCGEPAALADLIRARIELLVVVGLAAGPWVAAWAPNARRGWRWGRFTAAAVIVALYPTYVLMSAVAAAPEDWTWCLMTF